MSFFKNCIMSFVCMLSVVSLTANAQNGYDPLVAVTNSNMIIQPGANVSLPGVKSIFSGEITVSNSGNRLITSNGWSLFNWGINFGCSSSDSLAQLDIIRQLKVGNAVRVNNDCSLDILPSSYNNDNVAEGFAAGENFDVISNGRNKVRFVINNTSSMIFSYNSGSSNQAASLSVITNGSVMSCFIYKNSPLDKALKDPSPILVYTVEEYYDLCRLDKIDFKTSYLR